MDGGPDYDGVPPSISPVTRHRKRTAALVFALLALALATAHAVPPPAVAQVPTRPNVVVVMTDDQTVDDLRTMPLTRRAFVGKGVSFENSYVSYPVCCPSRATYLTGRYAHNHGVMGLYLPTGGYGRFHRRCHF